ncbi:hypothetical protein CEQ51_19615 [Pseudomonas thivervalensis]|uniref:Uncharacterized protein n=1 Tax=Pseudomonas thivervalensis TaxID=86265 RepID=A0A176NSD5_9PSED|nr:hypothetical protein CE140_19060 [Pseudomonas thivervalensis]AXA62193.1 hypothetical protein CEQ51_19615 [Pseudomonas thivervalensis]OAB53927.1 hypothetical protein APS14_17845 [Pseudomonas thivervalensis]
MSEMDMSGGIDDICGKSACSRRIAPVGADERSEAAILSQPLESQAKDQDQKIAGFASSYRTGREQGSI